MKIVIIGSRGIPCAYGGFETFAEWLAVKLFERGHEVTVYGQYDEGRNIRHEIYMGVKCFNFRAPSKKALQKPMLSLKSAFHSLKGRADIVFFLGVSAAPFGFINRIIGMKTVINLDGLEWKRAKWGNIGRFYLRFSEWLSVKTCNVVVADSKALVDIYQRLYDINSVYIPYGADVYDWVSADALSEYSLEPGRYILQSCRLEPENNAHLVIEGYMKSKMSLPLVILGDAQKGSKYKKKLLDMAGDLQSKGKIRFLGGIYNEAYRQIVAHSWLYIHAHEVGGTNPSLLEAMAVGKSPLYLDVPFNREVAGEAGFPFSKDANALAASIDKLLSYSDEINARSELAKKIIKERYSWQSVVEKYERLFYEMMGK